MALTKVSSSLVSDNAITTGKLVDGGVHSADIATNAITSTKIAQNSILTKHIDDGQVTTAQLGADAVTAAKIADDAISEEHLDVTVITGLTEVTAATGDLLMVADISDSNNLKKIPVSSILAGTHTGGISTSVTSSFGSGTFNGNLTVDDKLVIGDTTANPNSVIEFGKRIAASETNRPFIGQTNSGNSTSQDLGIGVRSGSGVIKLFAGNTAQFTESSARAIIASTYINFTEPLQMGGTEFLSDSRNLNVGTVNDLTLGAGGISGNASNNFALNTPHSFRINIDSDDNATDQNFIIGNNQTAVNQSNVLFKVQENGKVGIGTSNPTEKLTVAGAITTTGALSDDRTSTGSMDFVSGYTRFVAYGASGETGAFTFNTAQGGSSSSQKVVIDGLGRIGVGTIDPQTMIHIKTTSPGISFTDTNSFSDTNDRFQIRANSNNGQFQWYDDSTGATNTHMTILEDGNVGIGETSPDGELHVKGTAGGNGDIYVERTSGAKIQLQAQSANGKIGTISNHNLGLNTNGTTHVTIDTNGKVGIGTSNPTAKLDVNEEKIVHNEVIVKRGKFPVSANTNRRIRITLSNYASVRVYIAAQRTNGGNCFVYWNGYLNNNNNAGFNHPLDTRSTGSAISYSFTDNGNGTFDWDFNNTGSGGYGTFLVEQVGGGEAGVTSTTW